MRNDAERDYYLADNSVGERQLTVRWSSALADGSCNFCSSRSRVLVMQSANGFQARACEECLRTIKRASR